MEQTQLLLEMKNPKLDFCRKFMIQKEEKIMLKKVLPLLDTFTVEKLLIMMKKTIKENSLLINITKMKLNVEKRLQIMNTQILKYYIRKLMDLVL